MTTITESTSKKCNITASKDASESINAVGDKISVYLAPVESLSVGGSVFHNGACTVVPDSMTTMTMGLDTGASHTKFGIALNGFFGDCEMETSVFHGAGSSWEERTYVIPQLY